MTQINKKALCFIYLIRLLHVIVCMFLVMPLCISNIDKATYHRERPWEKCSLDSANHYVLVHRLLDVFTFKLIAEKHAFC
ncbi:hypothetical protein VNO77_35142 [Canavalia gladiata]|uniref:Uncharacterized protein n=1 Tax=Canavalia gladiata TaxID=3824 RepID=A0AAN9KIA3_CANGL